MYALVVGAVLLACFLFHTNLVSIAATEEVGPNTAKDEGLCCCNGPIFEYIGSQRSLYDLHLWYGEDRLLAKIMVEGMGTGRT